ncbi:MAG: succinate dehydrogenase, cytochrome b556 subunit [Rhodomicrobium sp.]
MADAKVNAAGRGPGPIVQRPLSPHLSIFRPYINMTMSVLHRVTGTANYSGTVLLAAWLIAAATSDAWFNALSSFLASPIGLIVLFGYTWSVMHHMLGGIRHFIWDTIHGFELVNVRLLSWLTIFGSLTLTGLIWMTALSLWGKLI